jgi:hypothetical protein
VEHGSRYSGSLEFGLSDLGAMERRARSLSFIDFVVTEQHSNKMTKAFLGILLVLRDPPFSMAFLEVTVFINDRVDKIFAVLIEKLDLTRGPSVDSSALLGREVRLDEVGDRASLGSGEQ